MKRRLDLFVITIMTIIFSCLIAVPFVGAGSSSLSKWKAGEFELVVSLKWEPTSQDKNKLESYFKIFAKDVYRMTEGKHTLKTLYVYTPNPVTNKAQEWGKADIQFTKVATSELKERANATPNGFMKKGCRIFIDDSFVDPTEAGHALAHELGHYAYGLYDEYAPKKFHIRQIFRSQPRKNDDAKDTLMSQHRTYWQFSVADDYSKKDERDTAQWRMYKSSAWTTLVRDPKKDSLWTSWTSRLGRTPKRFRFTDLIGITEPKKLANLSQPTNNPAVNIVWMEGSEAVIIIDHSGSMGTQKMASAKSGAKSYLDKLKETDYGAVVKFNSSVTTVGSLAKLDAATKSTYKNRINSISAGGGTAIGSALRAGLNILKTSTRQGTFKYIILLTDGQNGSGESPTGSILNDLKKEGYPVYSIGLGSGADMGTLTTISNNTSGKAYAAASSAALNAIYSDIQSMTSDDKLVQWVKDNLNLSKMSSVTAVTIDSSSNKAVLSSAFPTSDAMELSLTMPDGTEVSPSNVDSFSDVQYIEEAGYAMYEIENPMAGDWKMTLTAIQLAGSNSEIVMEGKTNSDYSLALDVSGGNYPQPILIIAIPSRDFNIKQLAVDALVTDPNGVESLITLRDDGKTPDVVSGDGTYAGAISDYTNGEYSINVQVSNAQGLAVETATGLLTQGSEFEDLPINEDFNLIGNFDVTASNVVADDHGNDFQGSTQLLTEGDVLYGKIESAGDIDSFYFDAVAGTEYTIFTVGLFPESMETIVRIYDTDQFTLLAEDAKSLEGISAKILWIAPTDGRYYVTVEHESSSGTGNYSIGARLTQPTDRFNRAPDCSEAYASLDCLRPPDHSLSGISIMGCTDLDGDPLDITITSITSDERVDSGMCPDAMVGTDGTFELRAERYGRNGRVYKIDFTASDGEAESSGTVQVVVPMSPRQSCEDVIDDGQEYDAINSDIPGCQP